MKIKRNIVVLFGVVIFTSLILALYVYFRGMPKFLIRNNFPEDQIIKSLSIYNYFAIMSGRYDIIICSDGSTCYLNQIGGREYKEPIVKFGVLPQEKIRKIVDLFKENKFFDLERKYRGSPLTDMGTNFVSITLNGKTKIVEDYGGGAPSSFHKIVKELKNSVQDLEPIRPEEAGQFCKIGFGEIKASLWSSEDWMEPCRKISQSSFKRKKILKPSPKKVPRRIN